MADNVRLNQNTTSGAIIAADAVVVATVTAYHQRVKISVGPSGSAADVHSGNPLPVVTSTGSIILIRATGTSLPVRVSGSVTIVEPITISGTVKVSGGPVSVKATGTSLAVKVSGSVTIVEPITISGTVISRVSGTVTIAEPITISGTVAVSGTRADRGTFTKGTSKIIPIGGYFGTGGLTASGQVGVVRTTSRGIILVTGISPAGATAVQISDWTATGAVRLRHTTATQPITVRLSNSAAFLDPESDRSSFTLGSGAISMIGGVFATAGLTATAGGAKAYAVRLTSGRAVSVAPNVARLTISGISTTTGNIIRSLADLQGRQVIVLNAPVDVVATGLHGPISSNVTATHTKVLNAPGANHFIVIGSVQVSNNGGSSRRIGLAQGPTGSPVVRWRGRVFACGGGWNPIFGPPWKLPANTAFVVTCTTAPNADVSVQFWTERT